MDDKDHREREHFFSAAKLMAGLTLLSRIMGMLRAMAIASLGAVRSNDAFSLAWRIPNLFRRLFGEGALSSAFVPIFTQAMEEEGIDRARKLLANAMGLLGLFLLALLAMILAGLWGWNYFSPGGQDRQLLLGLTAVMLPFMVTACLLAMASAALNCRGHFAYPAAAPILMNLVVILGAWWVAPRIQESVSGQLFVIAASVTVAGLLEFLIVLFVLAKYGLAVRPTVWPIDPKIKTLIRTIAPMLIGLGVLQFNELLESSVAWMLTATKENPTISIFGLELARPLTQGVLVRIDAARYLYQFPMGVLANSLAVAIFPLLSRYASRNDMFNLRDTVNRALRLAFMEGLAAGVGLFLLAEPIMKMLYAYRNFTPQDAHDAAFILRMYVLGMWAYCTNQIFTRAYYSVKDTLTPMKVSCMLVLPELTMLVLLVWVPSLGAGAFGLTTAVIFSLNTAILALKLRSRLGSFGGRKLLQSLTRTVIACAVMAGAIIGLWMLLGNVLGINKNWIIVAACVPTGAGVFLLTARLLRAPELGELFGSLKKKTDAVQEVE